jgi:hypothetical protein
VPFGFPSPFGPIANCVDSPFCAGERIALGHHRSSSVCCSTPGALAPVRVILSRSIVTYWPHPPHLQAQLDFAAWRLIRAAFAVRLRLGDPRVVPCFRCTFLLDMPPITTTRSPSAASAQFFTDDVSLRRKQSGSALLGFPSSASDGVCFTRLPGSLSLRPVGLLAPLADLTRHFAQPTEAFTPELSTGRSPFSWSGYNYGGN